MKLHKKCPACDSDNQYFRSNIDAAGGMGPSGNPVVVVLQDFISFSRSDLLREQRRLEDAERIRRCHAS